MSELNVEKALKYKAIMDFTNLNMNFSDIDGITFGSDFTVIIEEKFTGWEYEQHVKDRLINFANKHLDTTLVLFTQNQKDIGDLPTEEKIVDMSQSIVVDFYCNDSEFAQHKVNNSELEIGKLTNEVGINTFLTAFDEFVYKKREARRYGSIGLKK